ncbi:MAG: DNA-directed RNA polymerase subunit delta [Bacilli bacterium]|jgi:DNA-directed RNA polymerase subunit delta|nr:DNA-directed RNA polymerase subunit delta [Bacilli bacterium]MDD3389585.1 DNA-directed RNA polymerase subunit delta [Bacilli bacterium]MDD4344754.1 DNA-directed RNA polymerase subunit delta [Bacilli bacterium]MDD4520922.1 DNA-directed RNA polymerase subunit delta [Bacilli bacterium]MDY0399561.1 DNA-directed RNA polymerase subunit delta [Bacilli bacterium]
MVVLRSNLDVAFDLLKKQNTSLTFNELWEQVVESQDYDAAEKAKLMSRFYTNLTLDGRFVNLGDNTWDLREHNTYDKVHIDVSDVYSDVEEEDDDLEEVIERKIEEKNALLIDDFDLSEEDSDDNLAEDDEK